MDNGERSTGFTRKDDPSAEAQRDRLAAGSRTFGEDDSEGGGSEQSIQPEADLPLIKMTKADRP